jgi:hypothetical protein
MQRPAGFGVLLWGLAQLVACADHHEERLAEVAADTGSPREDSAVSTDTVSSGGRADVSADRAASGGAGERDAQVSGGEDRAQTDAGAGGMGGVAGAQDAIAPVDAAVAGSEAMDGPDAGVGACGRSPDVPLEGFWTEIAQLTCLGTEVPPAEPIQELHFELTSYGLDKTLTGTFSVTWYPIERYVDYRGTLAGRGHQNGFFDLEIASVSPYRPDGVDVTGGTFTHCRDELVLRDIWLGALPNASPGWVPMCGHRFKKQPRE